MLPFLNYERKLKRLRRVRRGLRGLREGLNTKELEERYLKYLPEEGQRNELSYLMIPESQVVLRQKLQEEEFKNLQQILRIVQRNRQRVQQVLLQVFFVFLFLLLIFSLLFKGPLFAEFLKNRLERILDTSVAIYQPVFRLNGILEYQGIDIAKPDQREDGAQHKILELGPGSVEISLWALLMDKLWLEDFLSEALATNGWGSTSQKEPDLEAPLPLSFAGIIAEAQRSFASFQSPSLGPVNTTKWENEIARIQGLIGQNYGALSGIEPNKVTATNSAQLLSSSENLKERLEEQLASATEQLEVMETELTKRSSALSSLNSSFGQDLTTLQGRIFGGNVLQAPLLYMLGFYLETNLGNFGEISLWLAAVLKNLQKHQLDFRLQYFEGGRAPLGMDNFAANNLKIANFDSDTAQSLVVAEYQSENNSNLKLLYQGPQSTDRRMPRHPSECNVFGIDICAASLESHAVYTKKQPEFQVSRELLSKAGLDFIRSYGGDLSVKITLRESDAQVSLQQGETVESDIVAELTAQLTEVNLLTSGDLNVLQEELMAILADYPLEIRASFYLSKEYPRDLLQLEMSSNITEILSNNLRSQSFGAFQNTVYQLQNRLRQDFQNSILPLQGQLNILLAFRTRLRNQLYALSGQKANAERAPTLIQRESERLQRVGANFGGNFGNPEPLIEEPDPSEEEEPDSLFPG